MAPWKKLPAAAVPDGASRLTVYSLYATQIVALALLAVAGLGFAATYHFGLYLSAVLLALLQASVLFVRLLVTSFRGSDPDA